MNGLQMEESDREKYERELLAARAQAEEAVRAKVDFVSRVSHELRTPMSAIIGIAHLLQDTSLSPRQSEYLRLLRCSSENLLNLLDGLLDVKTAQAPEAGSALEAVPDAETLRGVRVLVAEDNRINVFILTQFLLKWGVEFDVVKTGRQALERLQSRAYDAVMMDLRMPELDGYEVTEAVRRLPGERYAKLPIIALSASTRMGLEDRLASAGFTDFVARPFKPEELFMKLALYTGREPSAPAGRVPGGARVTELPAPPVPELSLEGFKDMVGEDPRALLEMATLTLSHYERCKQDFQRALEAGDVEGFDFHAHKIKMTMTLLGAQGLRSALQRGRSLLTEPARDEACVRGAVQAIHSELDVLIGLLRREVRRFEQSRASRGA